MQTNFKRDLLFPIIVGVLSIVNLIQQFSYFGVISTIASVIGIIGVVLFFLGNNRYKLLFYVWIVVQLVSISISQQYHDVGERIVKPIWDASQGDLAFYLSLTLGGLSIRFNLVAIFYLMIFRALRVSELKGNTLTFSKFKEDSLFGNELPVSGTVHEITKVGDEKEWMLVQLENPISNGSNKITYVLVKRKDGEVFELSGKNQIVYLRLVEDVQKIYTASFMNSFAI